MFFRPKGDNASTQPEPGPAQPDETQVPPAEATTTSQGPAPVDTSDPAVKKALSPEELKKRAELSQRLSTAVGELVTLLIRSPRHRDGKLSDLRWQILPAVRTGQYALIQAQSKSHGLTTPVAAVLWASVSAEVDKRLSEKLGEPIRLGPKEWRSGDILWLIDAIGDDRAIAALVRRLRAKEWKDKPVKARVTDANGEIELRLIEPQAALSGAATSAG